MRQTHVSSETVSRSKLSFVLLESRLSLSLFPQHLNMALPGGGAQTGVESLGKLFLLLSESVVTWCLARRKVYIQTPHKGHGTISSRGEMKPRSLQGVCEPAHPRLPSWPRTATQAQQEPERGVGSAGTCMELFGGDDVTDSVPTVPALQPWKRVLIAVCIENQNHSGLVTFPAAHALPVSPKGSDNSNTYLAFNWADWMWKLM